MRSKYFKSPLFLVVPGKGLCSAALASCLHTHVCRWILASPNPLTLCLMNSSDRNLKVSPGTLVRLLVLLSTALQRMSQVFCEKKWPPLFIKSSDIEGEYTALFENLTCYVFVYSGTFFYHHSMTFHGLLCYVILYIICIAFMM